jgi:hypothetical protein
MLFTCPAFIDITRGHKNAANQFPSHTHLNHPCEPISKTVEDEDRFRELSTHVSTQNTFGLLEGFLTANPGGHGRTHTEVLRVPIEIGMTGHTTI